MNKVSKNLYGWYSIFTFCIEEKPDFDQLKYSLKEDENAVLILLDIHYYKNKKLDNQALKNMKDILEFFYKYKKTILFRPTYDTIGEVENKEPDNFKLVKDHMKQISHNLKHIYIFQGLLVGNWAEMHGGHYCTHECFKSLYDIIYPCLGDSYLALRKPSYCRMMPSIDKLTLFDDGIFGSFTDLGTFGLIPKSCASNDDSWCTEDELIYINKVFRNRPISGEIVYSNQHRTFESYIHQLKKMHLTFLNKHHDTKMLEYFKTIKSGNTNLYEYIDANLGQRIKADHLKTYSFFGYCYYEMYLDNIGFSSINQSLWIVVKKFHIKKQIKLSKRRKVIFRTKINQSFIVELKNEQNMTILELSKADFIKNKRGDRLE